MKKLKTFDIVCIAVILAGIVGGFLFPTTGPAVLLDEMCDGLTVFGAAIWCIKPVISAKRSGKNFLLFSAFAAVLLIVSIIITKDAMLDLVNGSTTITLSECSVEKRSTSHGITGLNYYLSGEAPDGTRHRFKIAGKDYQRLDHKTTVTVNGYLNTGRIITYR